MKKNIVKAIFAAALLTFSLAGCKSGAPAPEAPQGDPGTGAEAEKPDSGENNGNEANVTEKAEGSSSEAKTETEEKKPYIPFDPTVLKFSDRVVCGNKKAYFMEDDGTYTKILSCYDNENIVFSGGDERYYFNVVAENTDDGVKYEAFFWEDHAPNGSTPLGPITPAGGGLYKMAVWNNMLYFTVYNYDTQSDDLYYYDPEGDGFLEDERLENVMKFIKNYRGKDLFAVSYDPMDDLMRSGHIYMQDRESKMIYVFDSDGVEVNCIDPAVEDGTFKCFGDRYLVCNNTEYDKNYRADTTYVILYDALSGENTELFRSPEYGVYEVVDIRDGCVYYCETILSDYKATIRRDYYREKVDDVFAGKRNAEKICSVDVTSRVDSSYKSDGTRMLYDAFSVRDGMAYFLNFFPDDTQGYRGDVMWCRKDMNLPGSEVEITDCFERHEEFADWGSITTHGDSKDVDGIEYFTASYEDFRFHDEVNNSDKLNEELEAIDESLNNRGPAMAENAESEYVELYKEDGPPPYKYSYEKTFGGVKEIAEGFVSLSYGNYEYYGGAHGMPAQFFYLFDTDTGKQVTLRDVYKGSEAEFEKIVVDASIEEWKKEGSYFYDDYSPDKVGEMRKTFEQNVSMDMDMEFREDELAVYYQPYSVGPFASGFIEIDIPYSKLGIKLTH